MKYYKGKLVTYLLETSACFCYLSSKYRIKRKLHAHVCLREKMVKIEDKFKKRIKTENNRGFQRTNQKKNQKEDNRGQQRTLEDGGHPELYYIFEMGWFERHCAQDAKMGIN